MRQQLLQYYERELGYMRQMGAEFARKYPAVAGRLLLEPDRCADPHVERLLESFAFLAARIHLRMDDDFPELTQGIMDIVYPDYLRPIPSMSVAEFSPDDAVNNTGSSITVPAHSELTAKHSREGTACRFRTGYEATFWPIRVTDCSWRRPEQIPNPPRVHDACAVLRLILRAGHDAPFPKLGMDRLVFYLAGESTLTLPLYELLSRDLLQILVRVPGRQNAKVIPLHRTKLRAMGFLPEESLLPFTQRSFQGHRLLQEYFSFQEKFLFLELAGLSSAIEAADTDDELEVLFYVGQFEQPERMHTLEVGVSAETVRLNCTPIINLFQQVAEPILISHARHEYPITASVRNRAHTELFSIDSVLATNPSRRTSQVLPPLFEHRFEAAANGALIYWRSTRRYSQLNAHAPSDVYLSIVDADGGMVDPNAEILTVRCTCTNHDLPSKLPFGDPSGDLLLDSGAGIGSIRILHRPTPTRVVPAAAGEAWSLISQLSLNHLSLEEAGLPALREILSLHNFSKASHFDKQIAGIVSLQAKKHVALMQSEFGSGVARGMHVQMDLDESHFPGGGAYLFGAMLNHFLGLYVSMNSFSQLTVRTNGRKEPLGAWQPRAGSRALL
jgi:type VI secretion system protein ImpG